MAAEALKQATVAELMAELERRGGVCCSNWTVEDARPVVEHDEECGGLSEAEVDEIAARFLAVASGGLRDILAERGNGYLADRWELERKRLLAERGAPGPR
jgi:hypothetical protein